MFRMNEFKLKLKLIKIVKHEIPDYCLQENLWSPTGLVSGHKSGTHVSLMPSYTRNLQASPTAPNFSLFFPKLLLPDISLLPFIRLNLFQNFHKGYFDTWYIF